jgi:hypothetical protein
MKLSVLFRAIIPVSLLFGACKKDTPLTPNPQGSTGALVRIQEGTDPDITNDTVYLISYNSSNKIKALTDSINQDTLVPTYDNSGNLTSIAEVNSWGYGTNAAFTYDANNLLIQTSYNLAGSNEKYVFTYTNGVISKRSYYSDLGMGGAQNLQGYVTYTVTGGNITDVKAFTAGGVQLGEVTATYTAQLNTFKTLSLFNYGNILGMSILTYETWFNTNQLSAVTASGLSATSTFTLNQAGAPVKIITNDMIDGWLLTWMFSYK